MTKWKHDIGDEWKRLRELTLETLGRQEPADEPT